ncbi:hypothetical protein FHW88_005074 [Mucilaginibacter sp. SG538B]|uniref:hypothetical protein n=1 Tax=Mucilaginibacter sp. SG538B TaxID=2587021 RepID=UPI00159DB261|nr:hypothetical protein [Mucilaginibacter sp. SG538B]NVM66756.1 hypothetical protein [Mucilaginibacter sp. SG538B]
MIKYFVLPVILFLLININSKAQTLPDYRLEFGVNGGGTTTDPVRGIAGLDIRLEKSLSSHLAATITAGYEHYFGPNYSFEKQRYVYKGASNVFPVKAGLKFFLNQNIYLGYEAGAAFGLSAGSSSFLYSSFVGYRFKNGPDLSLKYEGFSRSTVADGLMLRLAYGIDLGKHEVRKPTDAGDNRQMEFSIISGTTNSHDAVFGGEINFFRPLTGALEATASLGAFHIFDAYRVDITNAQKTSGQTLIPVMGGLRLFAGNKFYIQGEAGAAFDTHGKAAFAWAPSAGLLFRNGFDVSLRYSSFGGNHIQDFTALKLGYHFKL